MNKTNQPISWQEELGHNITDARELTDLLHLTPEETAHMEDILAQFPMSVTRYYLSLIDWSLGEEDPIRKMCLPSVHEKNIEGTFDTSGEAHNTVLRGVQHKYRETVLILSTSACSMYCRHCFRKRLVGKQEEETGPDIGAAAEYVKAHPQVNNVLISGGDAFLNPNSVIQDYLETFSPVEQLDFVRFGTRTPVVFPMRISSDSELLDLLDAYNRKKQIIIVTQFNHPREVTAEAIAAVQALLYRGIVVKNQTVLLSGINDKVETLAQLFRKLTSIGVVPYYVFQCRPVAGVKTQFQVPLIRGLEIVEKARGMQNGQGKCFRYAMSHPAGKIEIAGSAGNGDVILKFHEAKKPEYSGRLFRAHFRPDQCWLEGEDFELL